ncbi:hypothetical protein U1Q18_040679, partial [Sarracenia purpurea var. burkii]
SMARVQGAGRGRGRGRRGSGVPETQGTTSLDPEVHQTVPQTVPQVAPQAVSQAAPQAVPPVDSQSIPQVVPPVPVARARIPVAGPGASPEVLEAIRLLGAALNREMSVPEAAPVPVPVPDPRVTEVTKDFLRMNPPMFSGEPNPKAATAWL